MELSVVDDGVVQKPKTGRYKVGNDHINLSTRCFYLGELFGVKRSFKVPKSGIIKSRHRVMTASNEQRGDTNSGTKPQNPMQRPESPAFR